MFYKYYHFFSVQRRICLFFCNYIAILIGLDSGRNFFLFELNVKLFYSKIDFFLTSKTDRKSALNKIMIAIAKFMASKRKKSFAFFIDFKKKE